MNLQVNLAFIAGVIGGFLGSWLGWAIRAWPGHEKFHCDYLNCPKCEGGKRLGCYNAGVGQDRFYTIFSVAVAMLSVYFYGPSTRALFSWVFAVSTLIITVVDVRYLIIPDKLSINGIYAGLVYSLGCLGWVEYGFSPPAYYTPIKDSLLGLVLGGGVLWLLGWLTVVLFKKEGMGGGDVKLLAAFGAFGGWRVVLGTLVIASVLGSIGGILAIAYKRIRYGKKYQPLTNMIPFGPYLCAGFLFIFYFGLDPLIKLIRAYQNWFICSQ